MSDTRRMLSARRCQYENPSLPKYIVPYEDAAQVEHELNQCRRELSTAKAEAEKWEKLHDQDTEHLVSLQKRDNYGPTETLNQTAVRLSRELDEMTARAISLSMHLPPQTLACDVQNWRDEVLEEMNSLKRELAEARKQRDTLAEALRKIRDYKGHFGEDDPKSVAIDALATVKGGEA